MGDSTSTPNIVEPFDDLLAVDYEQQGDQWLQELSKAIQQKIPGANGYGMSGKQASSDFHYPHLDLVINTKQGNTSVPADTPSLKIVPLTQQDGSKALYVALAANRPITDDDKRVWVESMNEAVAKLNEDNPEFGWAAVLGQANDPTTQKYSLRKQFTINGVTIRSGRKQFTDCYRPSSTPDFNSLSTSLSWPIVIEGKSKGYDWSVASRQAGMDTRKVAVLLSLAWNSTWYLLQRPTPSAPGALKIPDNNLFGRKMPNIPHPRKVKAIPAWAHKALAAIDSDTDIESATTAYYQGLMLEELHPSFALIAFIASVEIIGKKIVGKKCACCGKRTRPNEAFRTGVDTVVKDKRKAKELHLLYEDRSGTAHDGELHANEEILGYLSFPSVFMPDSKSSFVFTDLLKVKAVSRKLLTEALKGKLRYSSSKHRH
jgi:hypothetical protein